MHKHLLVLTTLLLSALTVHDLALAQGEAPKVVLDARNGAVTALSAKALNATQTSAAVNVQDWSVAKVQASYTYNSATAVQLKFEESEDGTTWSKITKISPADAVTQFSPEWTTSGASAVFTLVLDVSAYKYIRVIATSTSGAATDLITVVIRNARGL